MKICERCRELKDTTEFGAHKQCRDGLRRQCKACTVEMNRENYQQHAESRRADARIRSAQWRAIPGNADRNRLSALEWSRQNAQTARARSKEWNKTNPAQKKNNDAKWRMTNYGKVAANVKAYKCRKRKALPSWANHFFMQEAYELAIRRTKCCGFEWHVDHVVPLQGMVVSGLHVESNLAVIPGSENRSKGNRRWPDMP